MNESELIYERYILNELFDKTYNIDKIEGVTYDNHERIFKSFGDVFKFHNKNHNIRTVNFYFRNKANNNIKCMFTPTTPHGSLYIGDVHELFTVIFYDNDDKAAMMLKSNDTSVVTSTVMNGVLLFLEEYKKYSNIKNNDWNDRIKSGIIRFDPYPNMTMNKVSKQFRYNKETVNDETQRGHIYSLSFNKIIKPKLPELNMVKENISKYIIKG